MKITPISTKVEILYMDLSRRMGRQAAISTKVEILYMDLSSTSFLFASIYKSRNSIYGFEFLKQDLSIKSTKVEILYMDLSYCEFGVFCWYLQK